MDSPGYNDTPEMDERTLRSAAYADVLAWVLTSRQLLSQVEMEFLANHVRQSGPASVVFILNGFLRTDTPQEWEQFLEKNGPQLIGKVVHYAPDMGFLEHPPPQIIPVAGRAMCKSGQNSFGGTNLLRFLVAVDSRFHPRVLHTRLWRASGALGECAAALEDSITRQAERLEPRKREVAEANRLAEKKRQFAQSLDKAVDRFYEEFSAGARKTSSELASRMTNVAAAAAGICVTELNREFAAVAEMAAEQLMERVTEIVRRRAEPALSQEWKDYFASLTRPPLASIHFPAHVEAGGVEAVVAAIPAYLGGRLGRPPQWLAKATSQIQTVTEGIITAMQSRRARFSEGFVTLYSLQMQELPAPDESALTQLREIRARLDECAKDAAKLASPAEATAAPHGWKQGFGA